MTLRSGTEKYQRYLRLGLKILFPSAEDRAKAARIAQSPFFDRDWYVQTNPRLPWLCRKLPARYYLLVGEKAGICPSPQFSPRVWRQKNPDLPPEASELDHYLQSGAQARGLLTEDRPAGENAPADPPIALEPASAPFAVVLHLYYRDMWGEFSERLAAQSFDFDLFVTLTADPHQNEAEIRAKITSDFPKARIVTYANHGRDIWPFLHLAQSGALSGYRAICKLHSKKSPHRNDGAEWRRTLIEGVLSADPQLTRARLATFVADPHAGLWAADGQVLHGPSWWGSNRQRTSQIAQGLGIPEGAELTFAAGSIYWISQPLLRRFAALPLKAGDFELECGQVDGTTAHALERLLGQIAREAGFNILETFNLSQQSSVS